MSLLACISFIAFSFNTNDSTIQRAQRFNARSASTIQQLMKAAAAKEIKIALTELSQPDLVALCLRLSRFKKENKELLTYLIFEAEDEASYIESVKGEIDFELEQVNRRNYFFIKKGLRKILRMTKKYIRYSGNKETEVILLIYFCQRLRAFQPSIERSRVLKNMYLQQRKVIKTAIAKLHEDLQYDYLEELENNN